jgi:hypothetical protein
MIVKRDGDFWSLISQVDHARHAGAICEAWKRGPCGGDAISESLQCATSDHDLGWTEADLDPEVDRPTGAPSNFTGIDEATHTAFYARAVRTIAQDDPTAAYVVSLHASGLYSRRYGWTGLKAVDWDSIGQHGRSLLDSERDFRTHLASRMHPEEAEFEALWRGYMLLETFDCLSLLTCFGHDCEQCGPVPTVPGKWAMLSVRRDGPWEIALDPYPFAVSELVVEVPCWRIRHERFADSSELREMLAATPRSMQATVYRPF